MPDVVMVAAPHPDDEVLGCGGSIACHVDAGRQVFVLYLSSGERGCPGRPPADVGPLREQEAAQAMETLGIPAANLRFLRLPDGGINPALLDQVGAVTSALRELRPELLYLPHPDDASFDHRAAFTLCWRAAAMAGSRNFPEWGPRPHWVPAVLGYEVWSTDPRTCLLRGHRRRPGSQARRAGLLPVPVASSERRRAGQPRRSSGRVLVRFPRRDHDGRAS